MRDTTVRVAGESDGRATSPDNARRLWELRVELSDGRRLGGDALREMSDFRRSIMRMKPEVDLDADFERFAAFITRCPIVMRARDRDGALRGTFVVRWIDGVRDGRRWRLVLPEYAFFHPSLRGSPALPWAVLRALCSRLDVLVGHDVYLGGVAYPTGVLALDGIFGPARFLSDPDLDAPTRESLERIVAEIAGARFDAATGRVNMPTRPPRPGPRWFERMAARPIFARYEARCPEWLDGYALPCVFRVEARGVADAVRRTISRSLRARWEAESA